MTKTPDRSTEAAFDFIANTPHLRGEQTVESLMADYASHLCFSLAKDRFTATPRDKFYALSLAVRDRLMERWIKTQQTHHQQQAKRVYYLSLEYLMGRALSNNIINLRCDDLVRQAMHKLGIDVGELLDVEVDAGLGNGGLGRLAACFVDSLATLELPAIGYGLRYDYGIFRQTIKNGYQFEEPDDWLRHGNPWEMARPEYAQRVQFGGKVEAVPVGDGRQLRWVDTEPVIGIPYDMPIVGFGCNTVNNLRLWSGKARLEFDFQDFDRGDYFGAVEAKNAAENITKVLYPNNNNYQGKELRFRQQYLFVSCSLQDIVRRYLVDNRDFGAFTDRVAIQLNDTHPALAIPELMRLLMDDHGVSWDQAWEITRNTTGYTNHTLLPEALEQWPVRFFEKLLPRHLEIIYEINRRFMRQVQTRYPLDDPKLQRMSLIEEAGPDGKAVRMANLAIVGSKSVNGVAALHTQLLQRKLFPDFAELWPERFNNKTNGVTPRRWLLLCNPELAALISERIGDGWVKDLGQLRKLEAAVEDKKFCARFRAIKRNNKARLAQVIQQTTGVVVSPDSLFDVHVKRLHEYKRQMLNVFNIIMRYQRLKQNPDLDLVPRTFVFGGKSAPGYFMAKLMIKLINSVADVVNADETTRDKLKVVFIPNYSVSLAEKIMPAADLSEQISTAGMEASGTGNMKFALNGALTIGTLDGANIEIQEEVGDDHIFIFGNTAEQVEAIRRDASYRGRRYLEQDDEIRRMADLLCHNFFNLEEPGVFEPIRQKVLDGPDPFLHLADLRMYADAQDRVDQKYRDPESWTRSAILNVARIGKFSSDRTIGEYNREIWRVKPIHVQVD